MTQSEDWITRVAALEDATERQAFLTRKPELQERQAADRLSKAVVQYARSEPRKASRLASALRWLANASGDDYNRALSFKATGHLRYLTARYEEALTHYRSARDLFQAAGAEVEAAMSLSGGSLQVHTLLGRYDEAFAAVREARQILEQHGDPLLLARLDSNEANIYVRQGRLGKAVTRYTRALAEFRQRGEAQDVAAALYNLAVCQIGLHRFPQALQVYEELSEHCTRHDMPLVAAQADYNVAYLHFLRGEYMRSQELYRRTRDRCDELNDPYHRSLCDLDQAEIHLELNLTADGARLAELAFNAFEELGNGYEAAKAQVFQAIAANQQREAARALSLFDSARTRFQQEDNRVWLAMIDLYQALILFDEARFDDCRRLAERAMALFLRFHQVGKVVHCQLLLARAELSTGDPGAAKERCEAALQRLEEIDVPASAYHAYFVLGQAEEAIGNRQAAIRTYRRAQEMLENLRSHLRGEELKIAFVRDKIEIYQSLVWMTLEDSPNDDAQRAAFLYIEQAKSRSLADLIAFRADTLPAADAVRGELARELRNQRDALNWTYRQIDLQELKLAERASASGDEGGESLAQRNQAEAEDHQPVPIETLRQRCREQEQNLLRTLGKLRAQDAELGSLQAAGSLELPQLQAAIPRGALLIEYFEARGFLFVGLLGQDILEVLPLGSATEAREVQDLLQLQLSKFQLTPDYLEIFGARMYRDTLAHLGELYTRLLAPIEEHLAVERLVVVPHGTLHYVPFHALWDGDSFLIDRLAVSYAPSASVFAMCCAKPTVRGSKALVLGVPDELAPQIQGEVEAVAAALPGSRLFVGKEATEERLRRLGAESRWVHIATHGFFRQDNPMFSAIQLGTSRLTLFDLYHLELASELVVLSGCATGVNFVDGGDELIGLTRGLLYAGARSALVTLWNVNDASTAEFMSALYRRLESTDRAEATRQAMLELRETHPHPYYWAPFVLVGKPGGGSD